MFIKYIFFFINIDTIRLLLLLKLRRGLVNFTNLSAFPACYFFRIFDHMAVMGKEIFTINRGREK